LAEAEDTVTAVCELENVRRGPDWERCTGEEKGRYTKTVITLGRECRERAAIAVNADIEALICENTRTGDAVIYTDGSVIRGTRSGWAYSARVDGKIVSEDNQAYANTTSSMRMEEDAATAALRWLSSQQHTGAAIVTDSQSMLQKIQQGLLKPEWRQLLSRSHLQTLTWIFSPGHAGVRGNERADELAAKGDIRGPLEMGEAEVFTALTERCGEEVGDTVERLREFGVDRGDAVKSTTRGEERKILNQQLTGTLSRRILREILRRRTEHMWVCPTCSEVDSAP